MDMEVFLAVRFKGFSDHQRSLWKKLQGRQIENNKIIYDLWYYNVCGLLFVNLELLESMLSFLNAPLSNYVDLHILLLPTKEQLQYVGWM